MFLKFFQRRVEFSRGKPHKNICPIFYVLALKAIVITVLPCGYHFIIPFPRKTNHVSERIT